MEISLLNLIATPVPVLNTLGLRVRVGLSAEDPMVLRHKPQAYDAFASIFAPDGRLLDRISLGVVPAGRRRMVDLSALTAAYVQGEDHLAIVHRVPRRLTERTGRGLWTSPEWSAERESRGSLGMDGSVQLTPHMDYSFYRAYLEYAFRDGPSGNGSVIYEMPHQFNEQVPGRKPSSTLTFTNKLWLADGVDTTLALVNCSTDPAYAHAATYVYGIFAADGRRVAGGHLVMPPFQVRLMHLSQAIGEDVRRVCTDPDDGAAVFTLVGYCEDAATVVVLLNLDRTRRGVSVEHTHPAQAYLMPSTGGISAPIKSRVKSEAVAAWKARLADHQPAGMP